MWQASQLIDLRARALRLQRLDKKAQGNDVDIATARQVAKQQIAEIQTSFWKLPLDALKRSLEMIDVRRLPELAPVVGRLRTAAACRAEFPKLSQESWMDLKLFEAFKTAVVLPPADAGYVRESFLARIGDKQHLKKIKHAVRKLQAEHPILYALEHDWFQTLANHKIRYVPSADGSSGISFSLPEMGWPLWLLVFFLIRALLRLISMSGGN
ncbi:MAG: hypothetical protein IT423_19165 [Pirellulaceae bacterium]|nr:hypothetical protein [Pirellulaceae bacterium]